MMQGGLHTRTRALKCQTLGGAAKTNVHCTHVQLSVPANGQRLIVQSVQYVVEVLLATIASYD